MKRPLNESPDNITMPDGEKIKYSDTQHPSYSFFIDPDFKAIIGSKPGEWDGGHSHTKGTIIRLWKDCKTPQEYQKKIEHKYFTQGDLGLLLKLEFPPYEESSIGQYVITLKTNPSIFYREVERESDSEPISWFPTEYPESATFYNQEEKALARLEKNGTESFRRTVNVVQFTTKLLKQKVNQMHFEDAVRARLFLNQKVLSFWKYYEVFQTRLKANSGFIDSFLKNYEISLNDIEYVDFGYDGKLIPTSEFFEGKYVSKEKTDTERKIDDLGQQLHTATPEDKMKIRKQIDILRGGITVKAGGSTKQGQRAGNEPVAAFNSRRIVGDGKIPKLKSFITENPDTLTLPTGTIKYESVNNGSFIFSKDYSCFIGTKIGKGTNHADLFQSFRLWSDDGGIENIKKMANEHLIVLGNIEKMIKYSDPYHIPYMQGKFIIQDPQSKTYVFLDSQKNIHTTKGAFNAYGFYDENGAREFISKHKLDDDLLVIPYSDDLTPGNLDFGEDYYTGRYFVEGNTLAFWDYDRNFMDSIRKNKDIFNQFLEYYNTSLEKIEYLDFNTSYADQLVKTSDFFKSGFVSKEKTEVEKKIANLEQKLHIASPEDKIKIRKQIDSLQTTLKGAGSDKQAQAAKNDSSVASYMSRKTIGDNYDPRVRYKNYFNFL